LNGTPFIPMELMTPNRKQIQASRSFDTRLITLPELRVAVTVFASRCAEKLRSQGR
jgi:DNA polymerase V